MDKVLSLLNRLLKYLATKKRPFIVIRINIRVVIIRKR